MPTFQATVTVLGVLLMVGALVSGLARRSMLSLAALFVLAGFVLGNGGLDWVDFRARSGFVEDLAFAALIVILFRDGLEVEGEMLQRAWHLPLRKLVLAMPLTTIIVAAAARLLVGLSWTESFLLGALLAPTDPVLTSSIVTNPRVPRLVRHSLNLESGLNDGLALPAVLAFVAALSADSGHFVWWRFVLQDVGLGFLYGIACGWIASLLMPRKSEGTSAPSDERIPAHQRSLFALGVAFATYGVTVLSPKGNGFIAVFVAAIVLSVRRPDVRAHFERNSGRDRRNRQAGDLPRVRLAADGARVHTRGLGGAGLRRGDVPDRPPAGGVDRAARHAHGHRDAAVHGLVRPEGRRLDDVRADRARPSDRKRRAHLRPDGARRLLLDHRARHLRHARSQLDRQARRARGRRDG